jgi:hypothetical protein
MIRWQPAGVNLPNVWQLFFVFPFLGVVLFQMWRNITCISCFDVPLQDGDGSLTSYVRTSEMPACHDLRGRKCLLESVNCDVLARRGTIILNELMGGTGWGAESRMFGE